MPLDKPIRRGTLVFSPKGDKVWVAFQYERLQGLCFQCGMLGHEAKTCTIPKPKEGEENLYGEWLRVGNRRSRKAPSRDSPSPPRRQLTRTNSPQTCQSPTMEPTRLGNPDSHDNDEGVTDTQPEINSGNRLSLLSTPLNEDTKPNFMEVSKRTELNEENPENKDESFINIPVSYVGNMVNTSKHTECETLVALVTDGQAREVTRIP